MIEKNQLIVKKSIIISAVNIWGAVAGCVHDQNADDNYCGSTRCAKNCARHTDKKCHLNPENIGLLLSFIKEFCGPLKC